MGGNLNELGGVVSTTGFSLFRPYDHIDVVYDGLDRVTSAIYYKDAVGTIVLQNFAITYSADGWPIENGTEYKNHQFDIYQGRFSPCCETSTSDTVQIVRGSCHQVFSQCSTFELISNTSNMSIIWPNNAEKITVVSTSSEDSSLGIGIRSVKITGISNIGAEISETIIMNGLINVISTLDFKRLNSITSLTSGTNDFAVGRISFKNTSLQIIDTISPGFSQSASLKYTIPTTQKLTLKALRLNADRLGEYEIKLLIWQRNPNITPFTHLHTVVNSHSDLHLFPGELVLSAETDIAAVIRKRTGKNGVSLFTGELLGTQSLVV